MSLFSTKLLTLFNVTALSGLAVLLFSAAAPLPQQNVFTNNKVDLGIVVSDLDRSLKFYTEVIGLTHSSEFSVPEDFCTQAGLTDGHALNNIQVLTPNGDVQGTGVKLMQLKGVDSKKADHSFVHSTLGYSYLTFHVSNIDDALARLKAAGVKPAGEDQVRVPLETPVPLYLTLVADPDGNLIELVGPKG